MVVNEYVENNVLTSISKTKEFGLETKSRRGNREDEIGCSLALLAFEL